MSFQIIKRPVKYDVCIVGSGAGGGMAVKLLADAGFRVALLEAGPDFDPVNNDQRTQLRWPWESPRRGASSTRPFGDFDMAYGGWELEGEPYTHNGDTQFEWFRSRMLGGRTNHWGRISLRFGPLDFKRKDIDGKGDNWPIGYEDVKPYYDKVDKLIGVFGSKENLMNEPDGFFLPPPKPRLHELYIKKGADRLGIPMIPSRLSILTRPVNTDRGTCFFCNQCSRACMAYADFSSSSVLVKPAIQTGNVDLYVNAIVREVITNGEGEATGVSYINKKDLKEYEIKAKVVILAASACSSARILLNSKSSRHPKGLGNSSELVGKYLHDSTGSSRMGFIPQLVDRERYNEDGVGGMHLYTPWWLNNSKELDFTRGYHIEYWGGMSIPSYGFGFDTQALKEIIGDNTRSAYGTGLKKDVKKFYGATFGMAGRGESIPRKENYCEIDPFMVDKFGIPVLRFNYTWSQDEVKQARHMQDTFEEIMHNMGAVPLGEKPGINTNYGLENPGKIIHEVGTTRMGSNSRNSVVNEYNQAHDLPNLFIMDGGPFVSQAEKNPTWTILALAWRATDYLIAELKKGNI